jgi:hypothetical protein
MSMARFTKKTKIAVLTAALVIGASGTAYAYWTQLGAGVGGAATGSTIAVVVNQTNSVTGLYPGGPAQALSGDFNNPNSGPVKVGAVTASVTATSVSGCLTSWYSITGTGTPTSQVLSAGSAQGIWSGLSVSLLNDAANQDVCKTATITITYSVAAAA